jgi:phage anti-repressor protein
VTRRRDFASSCRHARGDPRSVARFVTDLKRCRCARGDQSLRHDPGQLSALPSRPIQIINARDLHRGLGVGRDFSAWIKGRIERGQFVEDRDYVIERVAAGTIRQNGRIEENQPVSGGMPATEYHLSLDMAKHLALMENNPRRTRMAGG